MLVELRRFFKDESGAELLEWVLVTVILILAIYAVLQAIGPDIQAFLDMLAERLR